MHERMTDDEVRDWAVEMATTLAFYADRYDYPVAVSERLSDFYARMPHLTQESYSDLAARADA